MIKKEADRAGSCVLSGRGSAVVSVVVLEALFMGFANFAVKNTLDFIEPMQLNAARWTVASIAFLVMILTGLVKVNLRGKDLRKAGVIALLMPCGYCSLETAGINQISTSEASIILSATPLAVAAMSALILRIKIDIKTVMIFVLSFIGIILTIDFSKGSGGNIAGILCLLGAMMLFTIYVIMSRLAASEFTGTELTFVMCLAGAVWFNVYNVFDGKFTGTYAGLFENGEAFAGVAYLGIVCSLVCYIMLNYAMARMKPHLATMIGGSIITLTGIATGIVFKGDNLSLRTLAGAVLIVGGVVLIGKKESDGMLG